eukprot:356949-Chlamydomonas_euryale.AAC.4
MKGWQQRRCATTRRERQQRRCAGTRRERQQRRCAGTRQERQQRCCAGTPPAVTHTISALRHVWSVAGYKVSRRALRTHQLPPAPPKQPPDPHQLLPQHHLPPTPPARHTGTSLHAHAPLARRRVPLPACLPHPPFRHTWLVEVGLRHEDERLNGQQHLERARCRRVPALSTRALPSAQQRKAHLAVVVKVGVEADAAAAGRLELDLARMEGLAQPSGLRWWWWWWW